jgi:hypothetical protein
MDRQTLDKMRLEALRALGQERGIAGAREMSRMALIAALETKQPEPEPAPAPDAAGEGADGEKGLIARAKETAAALVERVEARAHSLVERLRGDEGGETTAGAEAARTDDLEGPGPEADLLEHVDARAERARRRAGRPSFDVPSSTVHPHAEELETLAMARVYAAEGSHTRAVEIYEKLLAASPGDETLARELADLRARLTPAERAPAASAPPPGPTEPMWMLDLEEPPETYGVDEVEVLYKDPYWIFVYWEVTERGLDGARAQLGQSAAGARLVLRLFTTVAISDGVERHIHDVDLQWNHGRRYLQSPRQGAHLRVAVGLLSPEGYFAPVAHSSLMRIPHAEPAPPGPVEWMEVVPARTRGREREPLVVVQRGTARGERGLYAPSGLAPRGEAPELVEGPPGTSPTRRTPTPPTTSTTPGSGSGGLR